MTTNGAALAFLAMQCARMQPAGERALGWMGASGPLDRVQLVELLSPADGWLLNGPAPATADLESLCRRIATDFSALCAASVPGPVVWVQARPRDDWDGIYQSVRHEAHRKACSVALSAHSPTGYWILVVEAFYHREPL